MANLATDGPVGFNHRRTYRAQTANIARGTLVKQGTADDQATPAGANDRVLGVTAEATVAIGDATEVILWGEVIAIAGAAVNAGDILKSDANGNAIAGNAADVETGGKAITTASGAGDQIVMFVQPVQKRS
jgi:hypothetical protein